MLKERLKIVVTGHVDHGKSTFIGRLLYDTNSLPHDKVEEIQKLCESKGEPFQYCYLLDYLLEEREKKITIDTTQIYFRNNGKEYAIIDAPGHTEFVKNMVTGAAQADEAFIILDVKEGNKEQTRRHATILSFLGFDQVHVLINKMDLVNYDEQEFNHTLQAFQQFVSELGLSIGSAIPICAVHGDNILHRSDKMNWYKGNTVMETLDRLSMQEKQENVPFVFSVQDIYKRLDHKLAVGKVASGIMYTGQKAYIYPGQIPFKIKEIYGFEEEQEAVQAPECSSILCDKEDIQRGNIILSQTEEVMDTKQLQVSLFWISDVTGKVGETLEFRCLSQSANAILRKINSKMDSSTLKPITTNLDSVLPLDIVKAELSLDCVCTVSKTNNQLRRFVLVKDNMICGGGIITNLS
jgi:GTPases - Sulfate adenylate transferase subunit 1